MTGDSWLYVLGAASLGFAFGLYCGMSVRRAPEEPIEEFPPMSPLAERMWSNIEPQLAALYAVKDVARRN